jgi:hypothetical protein
VPPAPPSQQPAVVVSDTFGRTVSGGFGVAERGGAWATEPSASFSVSGGAGHIGGAVRASRDANLGVRTTTGDIAADVTLDRAASGGGAYVSLIGRRVATGTDYRLKIRYLPGGGVAAYLVRAVGGNEAVLASTVVPGVTVSPGEALSLRLELTGTTATMLRAKVWKRSTPQPAQWQLTATDATPVVLRGSGGTGILFYVSKWWSGAAPRLAFDNLSVTS